MAQTRHPDAAAARHAAFANAVAYLVTGQSGGYGGPRVRDHAVESLYRHQRFTLEQAVELLLQEDGLIFGPFTEVHRVCWQNEFCFDDDPQDVAELSET